MERLMILAALATCTGAGLAVLISAMRARRPSLRLDSEVDEEDADLMIADVAPPASPIDRRAEVIEEVPAPRPLPDRSPPEVRPVREPTP